MPIYAKVGTSSWSSNAKKVWVKASDGWKSGTKLFAKTIAGWVQMWPGDAPASSLTDPIDIRLTGYNGARATSPQSINTVLYGNDGTITGATPITVNSRRMKISEDNTGNTTRYQLETTDVYNLTSNSETDIGFKRYMADGWWLFYELVASNVWSAYPPGTTLYSPAIKIIRQAPTFSASSPSLTGDYTSTNPLLTLNFSFSDTWWKAADLSRSYIRWWQNTSKSPGGTVLSTTYIDDISFLSSTRSGSYSEYNGTGTTISGSDYYTAMGGIPAGQYIIGEVVLVNSYTDHTGSPITAFASSGDKPSVIALSVIDDNGNGVVDNQSSPRIISDGYLNFVATVQDASASTYYLLEPRIYNNFNGSYYEFNSTTVIGSTSFPTDLTPTSTSLNGTTATVTWRIFINADTLAAIGTPTYSGGQPRFEFEFRVSARASSSSTNASASYFTGIASLGADSVYMQGLDAPAMVSRHPSSAMTLNVSSSSVSLGSSVTFSGTTNSYPSGGSSFPRRYIIDFGDGTDSGWQYFATGTSNPSFSGISKTYSSTGSYTAVLKWEPQGDPTRSTRARSITVAGAAPVLVTSPVNTNTSGTRNFSVTTGSWNNSPTSYSYQWKAFTYVPYPPYTSTINVGTNSSSYSGISAYDNYSIYCDVTATNTGGSTTATSNSITQVAPGVAPSGGGVTLTPTGTQMARTTISANVTAMSGTEPITYTTTIRKATGSSPTGTGTVTSSAGLTNPGTGTGNAVAQHKITDGEASGTPDQFKAYTVGTNDYGSFTVGSNTVISTPYVATQYTVTWNANGGTGGTTTTLDEGLAHSAPAATRSGYTLSNWRNPQTGGDPTFVSAGGTYTPTANITFWAQWTAVVVSAPSGGTATSTPSTGTAGTTTYVGSTSGWSGSPTSYSYSWQYFSQSSFSWVAYSSGTNFSPPANINTSYPNYGWQLSVGATNSGGTTYATTSITVSNPTVVTAPSTPTGVTLSGSGAVSWDAVSGADSYEVQTYTDRTGSPANTTNRLGPYVATGITGTSYQLSATDNYASPNNWARVQVRARNSGGVSTYSAWVPSSTTYT